MLVSIETNVANLHRRKRYHVKPKDRLYIRYFVNNTAITLCPRLVKRVNDNLHFLDERGNGISLSTKFVKEITR